ncbi:EAL domain-containing protein [Roseomonas sp. GC11]|uniref:EAL domain-containing protein n=1 Tax=Roseomonas sp. GC11 TaxID=2950546 RepID=UPI00210D48BE|nr:EAL domain-containing protein [Roseomonas sp. GC11]MCQ4162281.1 EAL domain-containing protein [Roseomonas sp. GC11]
MQTAERAASPNDRYKAFAFAAADLLAETDASGRTLFLAGTFLRKIGPVAETVLGAPLRSLIRAEDRAIFDTALARLLAEGRLPPTPLHLDARPPFPCALTGVLHRDGLPLSPRAASDPATRLALCFAALPPERGRRRRGGGRTTDATRLAREAEALLLGLGEGGAERGPPPVLSLVELNTAEGGLSPRPTLARDVAALLAEHVGPQGSAAELAPGRFGMVHPAGEPPPSLGSVVEQLQAVLASAGLQDTAISTRELTLEPHGGPGMNGAPGMSGPQAVRALRLALGTFAQGGTAALARTGFDEGLHGFVAAVGPRAAALARAIAERRFSLAFQPIVELAQPGHPPSHYEALLRPQTTDGLPALSPQAFVNLAEMVGLASELDIAVAEESLSALHRAGQEVRIACNVSGLSLQDPAFRQRLALLLEQHPPELRTRLLVEVTETAEIENEAEAVACRETLRQHGSAVCIDDFGAGAAGLSYLRLLRPDLVKLDGRFMESCAGGQRGESYNFAAALVELARATGAAVVVERIETEADADTARSFGARYGQGWLFGKPGALPGSLPRAFGATARRAGLARTAPDAFATG